LQFLVIVLFTVEVLGFWGLFALIVVALIKLIISEIGSQITN
jgi:hypothetical protein